MKSNKGFTLIEVIVTMSLMSIVIFTASFLLTTSARTFGSVQNNLQLQFDSQLAMSQVQEIIEDSNGIVSYAGTSPYVYIINHIDENNNGIIDFDVSNPDLWELHVFYKAGRGTTIFYDYVAPTTGDQIDNVLSTYNNTVTPTAIFAENVTRFSFGPYRFEAGRIESVVINYTFNREGLEYSAEQVINFKNVVLYPPNILELTEDGAAIIALKELRGED